MVEASGVMNKPAAPQVAPQANTDPSKTAGSQRVTAPFMISTVQDRDRYLKMLVYGKHGAGKTELLGTAVDCEPMRDVIMIDAESGDMTLFDSERIKNPELMHHIKVSDFKTVAYIQEFLKAYCAARDRSDTKKMSQLYEQVTGIKTDNPPVYRTVIMDSLSEIEAYCTYQILKIDTDDVTKDMTEGVDVAGWPEFRKNNEMVKLLARAFRDLPMHVLFSCALSYTQDERKRYHYAPALTGKLGSQIQGFVDIVGFMTVGEADPQTGVAPRRMWIQPISGEAKFDAKNRRSVYKLPYMDNPTMSSVMKDTGLLPTNK